MFTSETHTVPQIARSRKPRQLRSSSSMSPVRPDPGRGLPNRALPAMASQAVPTVRQMLASFGRTLTTDELANILHVSKRTIYRRIKANVIPSRRSGGQLRFDPGKVAAWWDGQVE
jgi:excisionase family DNA binding protein